MGENIGKNISKSLSGKNSQKLLYHARQSAKDAFKTASKWPILKTKKATAHLIDNKIANRITKIPTNSQQNNSETIINEHNERNT